MKFTPKSQDTITREERERKAKRLLPPGDYDFEVIQAEDKVSNAGNDMIKLTLRVFAPDGTTVLVDDYLMEKMAYKLRHFADGTGLTARYDSGEMVAFDCVGASGKVTLKHETSEKYDPKCVVKDYVVGDKSEKPTPRPVRSREPGDDDEDQIPM